VLDSASKTPAPVTLTFTGTLLADYSGTGTAGAVVTITNGSSVAAPLLKVQADAGLGETTYPGKVILSDFAYTAMTNTVEAVVMQGSVVGGSMIGGECFQWNECAGTAGFSIDPVIAVSASQPNAADYSLIFSSGIKNTQAAPPVTATPEPGTLLMMLSGLLAMCCLKPAKYRPSLRLASRL
jgi:hypothetical protein